MAEKFRYCEKCNKAVPSRSLVCKECGYRFSGDRAYTMEEVNALIAAKEEERTFDGGQMICPICGKRYDQSRSICEDCGTMLQSYFDLEDTDGARADLSEEKKHELSEAKVWFEVSRIKNGRLVKGNVIKPEGSELALGRIYIHQNCFPEMSMREVRENLNSISRRNALLRRKGNDWFIAYDYSDENRNKTEIRINGKPLGQHEEKRVYLRDRFVLGREDRGIVEIKLVSSAGEERKNSDQGGNRDNSFGENSAQILQDIQNRMGSALEDKVEALLKGMEERQQKTLSRIEAKTDSINTKTENIEIKASRIDENITEMRQILKLLQKVSIENFDELKGELKGAADRLIESNKKKGIEIDYLNYFLYEKKEKYSRLLEVLNEKQKEDMFYAGFYQHQADAAGIDNMEYSAPFIYLGNIVEDFARQTIFPLVCNYNEDHLDNFYRRKGKKKEELELHDITIGVVSSAFVNTKTRRPKGWVIKKMEDDYREKLRKEKTFNEIAASFKYLDIAREHRNMSAHSGTKVDRKLFMEAKENILETDFIPNISEYQKDLAERAEI